MALPAHQAGDGTPHSGAALHVFATGVAHRVVKADVASLYPSLMRAYRIGPKRDHLNALVALVDRLVETRLAAKASSRAAPPGSAERHEHEAMSQAMKLVVNSAYGYMAAGGDLTRFADVHAANEVTRRGRETLGLLGRELSRYDVSSRVRLTKSPDEYLASRESRRELQYEAMLASGSKTWRAGDRVRVYRARGGIGGVVAEPGESGAAHPDPRDYDVEW